MAGRVTTAFPHNPSLNHLMIIGKLKMGLYTCLHVQGPYDHCRISIDYIHSVLTELPMVFSVIVQIINKLLPCNFGLIPHLSHDDLHRMKQDLAWSSTPKVIHCHFVCLPFLNNHTNSYHFLTKLHADCAAYFVIV